MKKQINLSEKEILAHVIYRVKKNKYEDLIEHLKQDKQTRLLYHYPENEWHERKKEDEEV